MPAWISLNNLGAIQGVKETQEWQVAQPTTWQEFHKAVLSVCEQGLHTVVVDGLSNLVGLALPAAPTQADWGIMGAKIRDELLLLRGSCTLVVVIVDVLPNDDNTKGIAVNRDLYNKIVSLFSEKWYCYTAPDEKTGAVLYEVQRNGAMALHLRPDRK